MKKENTLQVGDTVKATHPHTGEEVIAKLTKLTNTHYHLHNEEWGKFTTVMSGFAHQGWPFFSWVKVDV